MNSVALVFFAAVAAVSAGVIAPAFTAYSAPFAAAYATPIATPLAAPVIAAYAAPYGAVGSLAAEDTVVAGPSGTIATSKRAGAPIVAGGYAAAPVAYSGLYW
ncbi:hypothetical protein WA026_017894 [Henosepilachna vigintioctopunctata]|uniref:Uncharacterized protein n=1 Tax=Henosepilachna vigintioctopunctata TaxID=420089 RepID=A0AAW1TWF5_9CUCU